MRARLWLSALVVGVAAGCEPPPAPPLDLCGPVAGWPDHGNGKDALGWAQVQYFLKPN